MLEEDVRQRFLKGIDLFNRNKPQPIERIESLGWRHAKHTATELELTLANVVEAYYEKRNG